MHKLQPLRIPSGWEVTLNKFLEMDIEDWPEGSENQRNLTENMAYLKMNHSIKRNKRRYTIGIDLGWYPEADPKGAFHVKVVLDENCEKPVREFVTRERQEVVTIIEDLLERYCWDSDIDLYLKQYPEKK